MIKRNHINNQSGIALVIALVILLALTVIGVSSLLTSTLDTQISGNERRAAEALNIADAGVERGLMDLLHDFSTDGDGDWNNNELIHMSMTAKDTEVKETLPSASTDYGDFSCTPRPSCIDAQFDNPFVGATLTGPIGNAVGLYNGPQELPAGSGNWYRVVILRDASVEDEIYLRSYALHSTGAKKIVQIHLEVEKVDAWRNAVFAGRGSGTNVIQGNIKVAGSIHILGTGEEGVVFALSGTAGVQNGYKGLDGALKDRISDDYIKRCSMPSGDNVECLEAVVRVKKGEIDLGGSGSIGEDTGNGSGCPAGGCAEGTAPDGNGDLYKTNVDAIFSNQGFTNESATDNVYADNFDSNIQDYDETAEYDLGDKVRMPQFNDPYDEQKDRMGQTCGDRIINCETYGDYIEATSLRVNDMDGNAGTVDPLCDLIPTKGPSEQGTPSFCSGCIDPNNTPGDTSDDVCPKQDELPETCKSTWDEATCGNRNGCIKWDPGTGSGATMTIEGRVAFSNSCTEDADGFFNIVGTSTDPIDYEGKGILYSEKNLNIQGDILSSTGPTGTDYFIKDNLIAVMTKGDMQIGTSSSDPNIMGAFYALGNMVTGNNAKVVGSLMSNSFDMRNGLTSVYYVAGMSDELYKMGMIRSEMVYTFKKYEWVEKW